MSFRIVWFGMLYMLTALPQIASADGLLKDLVDSCRAGPSLAELGYCRGVFEGALTTSSQSCIDAQVEAYGADPSNWEAPFSASDSRSATGLDNIALRDLVIQNFLKWFDVKSAERAQIDERAVTLFLSGDAAYTVIKFLNQEYPCKPFAVETQLSKPEARVAEWTGWVATGNTATKDGMLLIVKRFTSWEVCVEALDVEVETALRRQPNGYRFESAKDAKGRRNQGNLLDAEGRDVALFACIDDGRTPSLMSMLAMPEIVELYDPQ